MKKILMNELKLYKRLFKSAYLLISLVLSGAVYSGELPRPNNFGGDFTFESTQDKQVSISDWKGKLVLLNFGFTSCPDVCPMVLSKLTLVQNKLDKEAEKIQVIFVTVDPDRDDIKKISNYLKAYHPHFVGMRANEPEVREVLRRYGASVQIDKTESGSDVSHSDYVYVIDEKGYVAGFYDVKSDYKVLLNALEKLM